MLRFLLRLPTASPRLQESCIETARNSHSLDEFRKTCGIPFAEFNRTLGGLAGYEPISRASEHADALDRFLSCGAGRYYRTCAGRA